MTVVRYRPEVADDLRDAAGWYDDKRTGLGGDFLAEFWTAIDAVADRPLSFAVTSTGLCAAACPDFHT